MLYFAEPAGRVGFEKFAKKILGLPTDEAAVSNALQSLEAFFDIAESLLKRQDYMAGDKFTLIDIYYIPLIQRLIDCGYKDIVDHRKAVCSWWNRCTERTAIHKLLTADKEAMAAFVAKT